MEKFQELIKTKKPLIMGVLNVTPDSFWDGGRHFEHGEAVAHAGRMRKEGADIIDVGGESTRPGSAPTPEEEELRRVIPVIEGIRAQVSTDCSISIDTRRASVAMKAFERGATMLNILGGFTSDKKLAEVAAKHRCPVAVFHIKGTPETMQKGTITYDDVVDEISAFFEEQIEIGKRYDVAREQFILDPGIGFGKTLEQNLEIIRRLNEFTQRFKLPVLIGISRKSHVGALLKEELALPDTPPAEERLEAGLAETAVAVMNGAAIIRTHDVWPTRKFITAFQRTYLFRNS